MQNNIVHFRSPRKFYRLIQYKFLLSIIKCILVLWIYFTYDENIFSGIALKDERDNENYLNARSIIITGVSFFGIFLAIDVFIQILGFTFNYNKNNVISNI
jgi:hypothetical protein